MTISVDQLEEAQRALAAPLFADLAGDAVVSFEFFPPKNEKMEAALWDAVKTLEPLGPRFVSVTYGAGGSTRERTHATVARIQRETSLAAAAHLTCVEASARTKSIRWRRNIGPPAFGISSHFAAIRRRWARSSRRIRRAMPMPPISSPGLRKLHPFEISVAAYPECHPDSEHQIADLDNLKRKLDAGANRAITQFFFTPEAFFRFRDAAADAGIGAEIVPGILPVSNVAQVRKFAGMCGAQIPAWMDRLFDGLDDHPAARQLIAATIAAEMCRKLYAGDVRHFHFYTLNRGRTQLCHLPFARTAGKGDRGRGCGLTYSVTPAKAGVSCLQRTPVSSDPCFRRDDEVHHDHCP